MTTSGTYSFSVNRDEIIELSMFAVGAKGVGEGISSADLDYCSKHLNMLVKQWMGTNDFAPGLKMWARTQGHLFLSRSTGTYNLNTSTQGWASSYTGTTLSSAVNSGDGVISVASITGIATTDNIAIVGDDGSIFWTTVNGAPVGDSIALTAVSTVDASSGNSVFTYPTSQQGSQPIKIVTAVLRDSSNNDIPLSLMTLQDYESLPAKQNPLTLGDPSSLYYENHLGSGTLYTDVGASNDTSKHIKVVYLRNIQDFNAATDTPDYPQRWYRPLVYQLAIDVAPGFQLPVTAELKMLRDESLMIAQHGDQEDSAIYFAPRSENAGVWGAW